jgi:hypothetical protein
MPLSTIFQLNHGVQFYQWSRVRVMVFNATFNNISVKNPNPTPLIKLNPMI